MLMFARPQHWDEVLSILHEELTVKELQHMDAFTATCNNNPHDVINSVVDAASKKYKNEFGNSERANVILLGLQKAAKIGDVAIQHSPEVTALVWAGLRIVLEVNIQLNTLQFY